MKEKLQRISDFIESVKTDRIEDSTILLGGAVKNPDGINTTENSGSCKNDVYDACNKSTNGGDCQNGKYMCNNSKNKGVCNNSASFPKPINMQCENCGPITT